MSNTVLIDHVELHLAHSSNLPLEWVGRSDLLHQLLAAWFVLDDRDLPMTPRLIGKPGVGKTTLAYAAAKSLHRDVYLFQGTMDTRPEDLIVAPVVGPTGKIQYVASSIVTAMIRGGVVVLDEGNRMSEKAWASLAPLLDQRRYVESIVAGIQIHAHKEFRFVTTMNDDSSTYDLPEYIHSRLMPMIVIDFPEPDEETMILKRILPFSTEDLIRRMVQFLQLAHAADEVFTVRDAANIARYALKRAHLDGEKTLTAERLREAIIATVGEQALRYLQP